MATTSDTTRAAIPAFHAASRSQPSSTKMVSRGSTATRAVRNREPPTASSTGRNMSSPRCEQTDGGRLRSAATSLYAERLRWEAPDRGVEHLDGVGDGHRLPRAADRGRDLHEAAGVGGDEQLGAGRHHVGRLAVAEL